MHKAKAFIDTTILTNILIKKGREKSDAKAALAEYKITELPVYAIKEFKAGPLDYVKYLYNKLVEGETLGNTLYSLTQNWMQPNKKNTSIQLLAELMHDAEILQTDGKLKNQYGRLASTSQIIYDSVKLNSKVLLYKAWNNRRKVTNKVVEPLSCYQETTPFEKKNGHLSLQPNKCETVNCCLAADLWGKRFKLTKLKNAIEHLSSPLKDKPENQKRVKLLREIGSNPGRKISNSDCRNLGDVIFALYCPEDSEILTTNVKDHAPLAKALNKTAVSPEEILTKP